MYHTFKDHQGSLAAVVHGNTVERLSHDPWGRRRNPAGFGYDNVSHTFDRGFTGHEHLYEFGLVNMNGRMYDPVMSCFLSADRFVQSPGNSQNFNRYSYCLNNPLRYTDPDGNLFFEAVMTGVILGMYSNTAAQLMAGNVERGYQFWMAAGIGAVSGGLGGAAGYGAGLGAAVWLGTGVGAFYGAALGAASGMAGGFVNASTSAWMQGASFSQGLWEGLKSSVAGYLTGAVLGGLEGGYFAKQNGGNFWTGEGTTFEKVESNPNDTWEIEIDGRMTYSNEYLDSFSEANGIESPKNLLNSFADGSCPDNYHLKGSYFTDDDIKKTIAIARNMGYGKYNIYYSQAAFSSPEELYLTIAHEHLHLYLFGLGYTKKEMEGFHHASISRFEYMQAKIWNYNVDYYYSILYYYKSYINNGYYIDYKYFILPISLKPFLP